MIFGGEEEEGEVDDDGGRREWKRWRRSVPEEGSRGDERWEDRGERVWPMREGGLRGRARWFDRRRCDNADRGDCG